MAEIIYFGTNGCSGHSPIGIDKTLTWADHNLGIDALCEGNWCEEAQDGYAVENNIELED